MREEKKAGLSQSKWVTKPVKIVVEVRKTENEESLFDVWNVISKKTDKVFYFLRIIFI